MDTAEIRRRFMAHFERAGHTAGAVGVAAARRPEPAVRQRRHGAVQALLPRAGDAAVRPRRQRAEVRAHPGHRGRRQDHPPRHLLRDVRQLLLRRLLQGRRHRARLGPGHQVASPTAATGFDEDRLWPLVYDDDDEALELWRKVTGLPDERIVRLGQGELLVDGRARPRRPVLGDPLSTAARSTAPTATSPAEDRYLEFWNLVFMQDELSRGAVQGGLRHRRLAAEEEHRHRHGPRAGRLPAPGQRRTCTRSTSCSPSSRRPMELTGRRYGADHDATTSGSAWSPTTSAPR